MTSNREKRKSFKLGVAFTIEETESILAKIPSEPEITYSPVVVTPATATTVSSATTNTLKKGILNRGASFRSVLKKEGWDSYKIQR